MHKQFLKLLFYDVSLLEKGQYMSSVHGGCVSCSCCEVKSWKKKIVAVAVTSVCQTERNKRSCSDLMCGDCLAQPHEYLFHPWTVLVLQVPAEWHPCCSCLQPSHWVTNQSSRTHLAHPSGSWHWRNQWDSWREGHSPALCLSILRYLEFQLERRAVCSWFGSGSDGKSLMSCTYDVWCWELRGGTALD